MIGRRSGAARAFTLVAVVAVVLGSGCRAATIEQSTDAVTRWPLRDNQAGIGLILAAVRCGDVVFLADFQSKIRPVDIAARRQLPIVPIEAPAFALAADCHRHILYAVVPQARRSPGPTVIAIDFPSGEVVRRYSLPTLFVRGAYFREPDSLYLAAVLHPDPAALFRATAAGSFYGATHLGLRLSLTTGAHEAVFDPYEQQCIGAGTCLEVSLAPAADRSLVAQPTSTRVGVYDASERLSRVIDITSPGFRRTGPTLAPHAPAEAKVRWNAENSTISGVFQFARQFATVHQRPKLGADWVLGQPVNFAVLMNIHSYDGTLLNPDIGLPDLPIGQDDIGVFVVDYGERGRIGRGLEATLLRFRVE